MALAASASVAAEISESIGNPVTGVTPIVRYPAPIYFSDHQPKCRIKSGTNDKGVKGDDEAHERGIA
jgi:hypothetical protein